MYKFFLILVMLSLSTSAFAAADFPRALQDLIDEFHQENQQAPGLSLYVHCPKLDLQWSGATGTVSRESTEPLTAQHTFRIASNTKTYVAAAILRLVEMDRLKLSSSLHEHLPDQWRRWLAADGYDLQAITLSMVLSHTAGLNDHASDDRYAEVILANPQRQWLPDDQIHLLTQWFDPVGPAGAPYSYSDDGYIILGRILEQETGLALGPAVRSLLGFDALGLNATWWEVMEEKPAGAGPLAHQYYLDFDTSTWNPSLDLYGGGGLLADAKDLGRFIRMLIKGHVLQTEAMLLQMTGSGTAEYRQGLICTNFGDHVAWGHTGFWNTFVFHIPSLDLTVSGSIFSHHAQRGAELVEQVVQLVDEALETKD
ncbi:MAG: beta-lactamase family protein [bacterium]|nr:beta-lactamase family protein [bacterium]